MRVDCWEQSRCSSRHHSYAPIDESETGACSGSSSSGSSTTGGAPNTSRRRGLTGGVLRCGAALSMVALWVGAKSYLEPARRDGGAAATASLQALGGEGSSAGGTDGEVSGEDSDTLMQVLVTNKYQRSMALMYPWEHSAEPARQTRLEILSWPGTDGGSGLDYMWSVDGEVVGTGTATDTMFKTPGIYKCSVRAIREDGEDEREEGATPGRDGRRLAEEDKEEEETASDKNRPSRSGSSRPLSASSRSNERTTPVSSGTTAAAAAAGVMDPVNTLNFVVVVKYVRREIRTLTDRDRETFFNAVSIMQRVPSAVGQEVYGSKYYSKDYFNRMHLYYGGREDCDHWHAGAGFVTSHIAVSLMYEQSLQAINPSIALPYWDFTIEGTFFDWSNFRSSSIFSDDWFGSAAPQNRMRTPARGRFGYIPNMVNATEFSSVRNSYGMLQAPWNNDPTPFLTRSDHLMGFVNHRKPSGCRRYREAIMQTSWMALTESFNEGAHGEIHELLGGAWSLEATAYAERTSDVVQPFVHVAVPLLKMLWRTGYMQCPAECGLGVTPWEECACTCSEENFAGKSSWEVLQASGVLAAGFFYDQDGVLIEDLVDDDGNAFDIIPGYTKDETVKIYDEMLRALCIPMRVGTHYGATSTNDPTFWLIHPTFDRLWHLRRLEVGANSETRFDETWIPDHFCYGHNPEDTQPFRNLFLKDIKVELAGGHGDKKIEIPKVYYTNSQLYDMLKPDQMDSPYVYDNFEWGHCDAQGVYIHGF